MILARNRACHVLHNAIESFLEKTEKSGENPEYYGNRIFFPEIFKVKRIHTICILNPFLI